MSLAWSVGCRSQSSIIIAAAAAAKMASQSTELLHLYRRLLRSSATYPSKNRWGIYEAIREEFRDNRTMNPDDPKTQKQIQVAYKGLGQLRMYDTVQLVSAKRVVVIHGCMYFLYDWLKHILSLSLFYLSPFRARATQRARIGR